MLAGYEHGIWFVPLADARGTDTPLPAGRSPGVLAAALAAGFGLAARNPDEPQKELLDYLRAKQLLLVLDSMEHLLGEAGFITALLQNAPNVTMLITSREPLNFQAECVLRLEGLLTPASADDPVADAYDSVRLFAERAERSELGFTLNARNLPDVVRICRFVQGLPLAIELAATWAKRLLPSEIAEAITGELDFLTTALRDVPARHRSMRAVFEESWGLLSPAEQETLTQVAVFDGRFSQVMALGLAGAAPAELDALVDKSLLRQTEHAWYEMPELLRRFAIEKQNTLALAGPAPAPTLRERQSAGYLEFGAGAHPS
jgi:predicted ATPase